MTVRHTVNQIRWFGLSGCPLRFLFSIFGNLGSTRSFVLEIKKCPPLLLPVLTSLEAVAHQNKTPEDMFVFQLIFCSAVQTIVGGRMVDVGYPLSLCRADEAPPPAPPQKRRGQSCRGHTDF